jgi:putative DNA methylase
MTTPARWYKPKLIEVAIPLEDINRESAREKSIRHGHPSTLHLWWARRPLAACRAVLFAQLVDDPSAHPEEFPTEEAQKAERERLHGIIKRLVVWENIHDEALLKEARTEIWKSCSGNPPPILDPFAGGGSIPLEAQRLGLEARASDLNPVAVLINKALIEIPPKWTGCAPVFPGAAGDAHSWPGATGLAEDVRCYGQWMHGEAAKRIGHLYPKAKLSDGTETSVIAWIWARTITCPNPACAGTMPLVRSFWLGKKKGKEHYVEPLRDGKRVRFEICGPQGTPREGTVGRKGAICLLCGTPVPLTYVRAEGKAGRMRAQLMAIAAEGVRQRIYLPANDEHIKAAEVDRPENVPDEELARNPRDFKTPNYGMVTFADLFTNRQLIALTTYTDLVREARGRVLADATAAGLSGHGQLAAGGIGSEAYADAVCVYLALAGSRISSTNSSLCRWRPDAGKESVNDTFSRQALPMVWDFAEGCPFADGPPAYSWSISWVVRVLQGLPRGIAGIAEQCDAIDVALNNWLVVATDPPYYDNVSYADLSDFFYVWIRPSLAGVYPELMGTLLTPKDGEIVADAFRHGGPDQAKRFFEARFEEVFTRIREGTPDGYPISFFYAYKQAETDGDGNYASTGWETLLEGMLRTGWAVTGTWPMRTELGNRMLSIGSNVLASSIILACRPRAVTAKVTDRRGLIAALRAELPEALVKLQQGSIAPVDLPQAAIGPGMAVFSRYARVNEPDGSAMKVRTALALINQVLDEVLSQQEGDFGTDTRWCLEWFKSYGFNEGPYGAAETLSKAKNTSIGGLERAGVLWSRGGRVRLLSVRDIPGDYEPERDERVSEWEIVLHLAKALSEQGGEPAARLMLAAKAVVDIDAVRELAYLLFSIAEKRGWAETARLFNGLGTSWSDMADQARQPGLASRAQVQGQLGYEAER